MSKVVSILVSIGLLVAVDRAAVFWKHSRTGMRAAAMVESQPTNGQETATVTAAGGASSNAVVTTMDIQPKNIN